MKTLDQVEARVPLDATHLQGDADSDFVIPATASASSYYLTGNVKITKKFGIHVFANHVTIDLNGFSIERGSGTLGIGILLESGSYGCAIKNGSIRGFATGVSSDYDGSVAPGTDAGRISHLTVTDCAGGGIDVGRGWEVADCMLDRNSTGLRVNVHSVIRNCVANNNGQSGINANGSVVLGCTANSNGGSGIVSNGTITNCRADGNSFYGIYALAGSVVQNCSVSSNLNGIALIDVGQVTGCAVINNKQDGIVAGTGSKITDNDCSLNGAGTGVTNGAGIHVTGSGSRIDSNNTSNNDIGILVSSGGNLIIRNSSRGGSNAFDIAAGNSEGQEINVFNANTTTVITNSNPWANFLY
jgi:hypothetical protein